MSTLIDIAEVAGLLAVSYGVGWAMGLAARTVTARSIASQPGSASTAVAATMPTAAADALVTPPVILPVAATPIVPVSASTATLDPTAEPAKPEPSGIDSLKSLSASMPLTPSPPEPAAESAAPAPEPAPPSAPSPMPASAPGLPWTGSRNGQTAPRFAAPALPTEPDAPMPPTPDPASPVDAGAPSEPSPALDEDAAMRAIEGGWSRSAARDGVLTDVTAAVSAAQSAVEQVLTRNGVDPDEPTTRAQAAFGKPRGLPRPRAGGRDDLRQIEGLGDLDQMTLNNLGIFHFDQVANWDEREVLWLENHAFAVGRIGRENWQAQARALGAETAARRVGR